MKSLKNSDLSREMPKVTDILKSTNSTSFIEDVVRLIKPENVNQISNSKANDEDVVKLAE